MKRPILSTLAAVGIGAAAAFGLAYGIDHDPDLAPTPKSHGVTATPTIAEDDPAWNCLTMGNRTCGPDYVPVDAEMADALMEASDQPVTYRWEACLADYGTDGAYTVVCPDGTVVTA